MAYETRMVSATFVKALYSETIQSNSLYWHYFFKLNCDIVLPSTPRAS